MLARHVSGAEHQTLALSRYLGRDADPRMVLAKLQDMSRTRYVTPYHVAYVYTGLGEHESRARLPRAGVSPIGQEGFTASRVRTRSRPCAPTRGSGGPARKMNLA